MAKRVFFSLHYQDVKEFRANVPRKSWLIKKDREDAGSFDASLWETSKKVGSIAIKRLINRGLSMLRKGVNHSLTAYNRVVKCF